MAMPRIGRRTRRCPKALGSRRSGRVCGPSEGVEKPCRCAASPAAFLLPDGPHNEEIDQRVIKDLETKNAQDLFDLPREHISSGSSEIRNWIAASGATEHLDFNLIDYAPCYRSPAGTGCAMAFGSWS